jgi:hypothetical protein
VKKRVGPLLYRGTCTEGSTAVVSAYKRAGKVGVPVLGMRVVERRLWSTDRMMSRKAAAVGLIPMYLVLVNDGRRPERSVRRRRGVDAFRRKFLIQSVRRGRVLILVVRA